MITYNILYQSVKTLFREHGSIETPDLDARLLICAYAEFDQADFIVSGDKSVDKSVENPLFRGHGPEE